MKPLRDVLPSLGSLARPSPEKSRAVLSPDAMAEILSRPPSPALARVLVTAEDRRRFLHQGLRELEIHAPDDVAREAQHRLAAVHQALMPAPIREVERWLNMLAPLCRPPADGEALGDRIEALSGALMLPSICFTPSSLIAAAAGRWFPCLAELNEALAPYAAPLRALATDLAAILRANGEAVQHRQDAMAGMAGPGATPTPAEVEAQVASYERQPPDRYRAICARVYRRKLLEAAPALLAPVEARLSRLADACWPETNTLSPETESPVRAVIPPNLPDLRANNPLIKAAIAQRDAARGESPAAPEIHGSG